MNPMGWIAIIGIVVTMVLAIIGHIIVSVFWAGKVTAKLDILISDSSIAKVKLEAFEKTCFTKSEAELKLEKADDQHKAMWKRMDSLKRSIIKLFQKHGMDLTQEDI